VITQRRNRSSRSLARGFDGLQRLQHLFQPLPLAAGFPKASDARMKDKSVGELSSLG
jgi:hypothetical protein